MKHRSANSSIKHGATTLTTKSLIVRAVLSIRELTPIKVSNKK